MVHCFFLPLSPPTILSLQGSLFGFHIGAHRTRKVLTPQRVRAKLVHPFFLLIFSYMVSLSTWHLLEVGHKAQSCFDLGTGIPNGLRSGVSQFWKYEEICGNMMKYEEVSVWGGCSIIGRYVIAFLASFCSFFSSIFESFVPCLPLVSCLSSSCSSCLFRFSFPISQPAGTSWE